MAAAMNNQSKTIEYLLEKGADLNQRSKGGDTVLHAGVFGSHAIVKKLINKGVSVNQLNKSGISPVKLAIYLKKTAIIKLLLKHSANPNFHGKAPTAAVIKKISSSHIKN